MKRRLPKRRGTRPDSRVVEAVAEAHAYLKTAQRVCGPLQAAPTTVGVQRVSGLCAAAYGRLTDADRLGVRLRGGPIPIMGLYLATALSDCAEARYDLKADGSNLRAQARYACRKVRLAAHKHWRPDVEALYDTPDVRLVGRAIFDGPPCRRR